MKKEYTNVSLSEGAFESLLDEFVQTIRTLPRDELEKAHTQLNYASYGNDTHLHTAVMAWMTSFLQAQKYKMCV